MSKEITVIVLGIWVMVVPYLGVPASWKTIIFILTGFALIFVGFLLRTEALTRTPGHSGRRSGQHFVEKSAPPAATQENQLYHDQTSGIHSLN